MGITDPENYEMEQDLELKRLIDILHKLDENWNICRTYKGDVANYIRKILLFQEWSRGRDWEDLIRLDDIGLENLAKCSYEKVSILSDQESSKLEDFNLENLLQLSPEYMAPIMSCSKKRIEDIGFERLLELTPKEIEIIAELSDDQIHAMESLIKT